jgi:NAD(P)-dependent dehydrogenase (short-subunit alcohol dehydrogenase family)
MSNVIVTGAAGLFGSENVQRFAREDFRVANRRKLIKPV